MRCGLWILHQKPGPFEMQGVAVTPKEPKKRIQDTEWNEWLDKTPQGKEIKEALAEMRNAAPGMD